VAAAYGGGGLGVLGASVFGTLAAQAKLARRTIGEPSEQPPRSDGLYGASYGDSAGEPLTFAMLGDSSAAGLGVHRADETPGAVIAAGLAEQARRPVRLHNVARTGARSGDLERQLGLVLEAPPQLAVIMVGANDVTHRVRPSTSVRLLVEAVRRLRDAGAEVVVGTCPDLGTIEPIAQPLRTVARTWSRSLAAAQTIAVVEAGGRTVSLGNLLGPEFAAAPKDMFGPDGFHPSAAGYRACALALLPSACAALGYWPEPGVEEAPDARRGEGLRSVADAAAEASDRAGTEVSPAEVAGRERGPWGRWALLRHRGGRQVSAVPEAADLDEPGEGSRRDVCPAARSTTGT
jgi:lysophospholipase L1-like esterase